MGLDIYSLTELKSESSDLRVPIRKDIDLMADIADQLRELGALRDAGVLDHDEFKAAKVKLLGEPAPAPAPATAPVPVAVAPAAPVVPPLAWNLKEQLGPMNVKKLAKHELLQSREADFWESIPNYMESEDGRIREYGKVRGDGVSIKPFDVKVVLQVDDTSEHVSIWSSPPIADLPDDFYGSTPKTDRRECVIKLSSLHAFAHVKAQFLVFCHELCGRIALQKNAELQRYWKDFEDSQGLASRTTATYTTTLKGVTFEGRALALDSDELIVKSCGDNAVLVFSCDAKAALACLYLSSPSGERPPPPAECQCTML